MSSSYSLSCLRGLLIGMGSLTVFIKHAKKFLPSDDLQLTYRGKLLASRQLNHQKETASLTWISLESFAPYPCRRTITKYSEGNDRNLPTTETHLQITVKNIYLSKSFVLSWGNIINKRSRETKSAPPGRGYMTCGWTGVCRLVFRKLPSSNYRQLPPYPLL